MLRIRDSGESVRRVELPFVSTGIAAVLRNAWFVFRRHDGGILHVTGDVHYAAMLRPFSRSIVTVHDCIVLQRGSGLKRFVFWLLWFWLPLRLAAAVTVISEQTKKEVLNTVRIPESKITVVPNFVDPSFEFRVRRFASVQPRILHIGTTPNKNLSRVIDALRGIRCTLVIVGPLTPAILAALEVKGQAYENHVGLNHSELVRQYEDADLISFPSTYEGFGMPILEGQAVGRPVLTSDLEPMRSVAGRGALLVDPESTEAIRAGFLALLGDEALRTQCIAEGRENCRRFSLDAVATQYRLIYERIRAR